MQSSVELNTSFSENAWRQARDCKQSHWFQVFSSACLGTCNEPHSKDLSVGMTVTIFGFYKSITREARRGTCSHECLGRHFCWSCICACSGMQTDSYEWSLEDLCSSLESLCLFCQCQSRNEPLEQFVCHSLQKDHWKKFQCLMQ